jgi:hypothetical protein
MKTTALVLALGLSLAAAPAFAQTETADATAKARAAPSSALAKTLVIGAGVVAGVAAADLLMGGALVRPLLGLPGAAAAPARLYTPAQMREYRAAGAVIGEGITAATEARDVPARTDLLRSLALVLGGIAGWLGVEKLAGH